MNIETLLHKEIKREFEKLKETEVGTDDYRTTVDGITKLVDRAIEMKKLGDEYEEKVQVREIENELKRKQMTEDRIDRIVKDGIAVAGIIIPTVVTIWGTIKSFKFEENGTITTIMGRGFINKLLPRK